jgi:hypothetical protein
MHVQDSAIFVGEIRTSGATIIIPHESEIFIIRGFKDLIMVGCLFGSITASPFTSMT